MNEWISGPSHKLKFPPGSGRLPKWMDQAGWKMWEKQAAMQTGHLRGYSFLWLLFFIETLCYLGKALKTKLGSYSFTIAVPSCCGIFVVFLSLDGRKTKPLWVRLFLCGQRISTGVLEQRVQPFKAGWGLGDDRYKHFISHWWGSRCPERLSEVCEIKQPGKGEASSGSWGLEPLPTCHYCSHTTLTVHFKEKALLH